MKTLILALFLFTPGLPKLHYRVVHNKCGEWAVQLRDGNSITYLEAYKDRPTYETKDYWAVNDTLIFGYKTEYFHWYNPYGKLGNEAIFSDSLSALRVIKGYQRDLDSVNTIGKRFEDDVERQYKCHHTYN